MGEFLRRSDPNNHLPTDAVPDVLDDEAPGVENKSDDITRGVLLIAEDLGGVKLFF